MELTWVKSQSLRSVGSLNHLEFNYSFIYLTLLLLILSRLLLPLPCSPHTTRNLHPLNSLYSHHHPWLLLLLNPRLAVASAMEDLNTIAADCVVLCCCCQCLILQILVFALLRLPARLAKRTTEYAKRRLNRRRRSAEILRIREEECSVRVRVGAERESVFGDDEVEGRDRCEKCIEEVEKVMMELYEKGEFGFGGFWGRGRREREESGRSVAAINLSSLNQIGEEGDGEDFVRYQIIRMAGSFPKHE